MNLKENQPENIYPLLMVHDSQCDIMGSCATYQTRKNITETVGSGQGAVPCSMKDVEERWVINTDTRELGVTINNTESNVTEGDLVAE